MQKRIRWKYWRARNKSNPYSKKLNLLFKEGVNLISKDLITMKELVIKIPEESAEFVTSLLQKLGAEVKEKDIKPAEKKKAVVSPTFLFGKWKGIDLDAKELRKKAWDRSHKF